MLTVSTPRLRTNRASGSEEPSERGWCARLDRRFGDGKNYRLRSRREPSHQQGSRLEIDRELGRGDRRPRSDQYDDVVEVVVVVDAVDPNWVGRTRVGEGAQRGGRNQDQDAQQGRGQGPLPA